MATHAEIEAAAMAIQAIEDPLEPVSEFIPAARAALEAAERVRPRRDLTAAARMRQFRAKRRAEHAVTRAVTREVTPERAVTGDVTRAVTREAAPIDKIDSERASQWAEAGHPAIEIHPANGRPLKGGFSCINN